MEGRVPQVLRGIPWVDLIPSKSMFFYIYLRILLSNLEGRARQLGRNITRLGHFPSINNSLTLAMHTSSNWQLLFHRPQLQLWYEYSDRALEFNLFSAVKAKVHQVLRRITWQDHFPSKRILIYIYPTISFSIMEGRARQVDRKITWLGHIPSKNNVVKKSTNWYDHYTPICKVNLRKTYSVLYGCLKTLYSTNYFNIFRCISENNFLTLWIYPWRELRKHSK